MGKSKASKEPIQVVYHLRDINKAIVDAWTTEFANCDNVKASYGDIFKGAPAADAIVSPANSFGFMDGGIDLAYSQHFGWQMQHRLQEVIRKQYDGEVLVGQAAIVETMPTENAWKDQQHWDGCNENQPIRFLICAPTMRVPMEVDETANAFLAFRAVIQAVQKHNSDASHPPIRSVLCPGLGTAVGRMKPRVCARQMVEAYEAYELREKPQLLGPKHLIHITDHHNQMVYHVEEKKKIQPPPKNSAPPKAKPVPKAEERKSESSTWRSYGFIALWFVLSIVGLVAGFYLEVYLVARYEKPPADGDVMAEDVVADDILTEEL